MEKYSLGLSWTCKWFRLPRCRVPSLRFLPLCLYTIIVTNCNDTTCLSSVLATDAFRLRWHPDINHIPNTHKWIHTPWTLLGSVLRTPQTPHRAFDRHVIPPLPRAGCWPSPDVCQLNPSGSGWHQAEQRRVNALAFSELFLIQRILFEKKLKDRLYVCSLISALSFQGALK